MSTEVVMPQMGESIAEGTITKWLKKVGDHVERDEPLFEISTDKVDAEIPSPAAGTLSEIRFKEGDTVEINVTVAVLDDGAAAPAKAEAVTAAPATPVTAPEPPAAKTDDAATQQAEVTTAAATTAETTSSKAPAGSAKPAAAEKGIAPPVTTASSATSAPAGNGRSATQTAEELRRTKSSPLVRKIAEEHGVDIAGLEGTGMSGRVTKNDILSFIESGSPATTGATATARPAATPQVSAPASLKPATGDRVEQMSVMRKKIAEHMVQSRRTSAHVTTVYEIDMTRIARLREQNKNSFV